MPGRGYDQDGNPIPQRRVGSELTPEERRALERAQAAADDVPAAPAAEDDDS